jgi:DNA-binding LacI/PurR family transcriptional regulator
MGISGPSPLPSERPLKQDLLLWHLRDSIISGELLPGQRLPVRAELKQQFDVANTTVQAVFDRLLRDGFVQTRGSRGTFVSDRPPHLSHFALSMYTSHPEQSLHFRALLQSAVEVQQERQRRSDACRISTYLGLDGHSDVEDFHRLLGEVRHRRLAGIVFASPPFGLEQTPLVQEPSLPRVVFGGPSPGIPSISPDYDRWLDRAVEHLASRGKRRLAMLHTAQHDDPTGGRDLEQRFVAAVRARRLSTRVQWVQFVSPQIAWSAQRFVGLLMLAPRDQRPDGLLIGDDHLVEAATRGLVSAGVRVPRDLEVVAHCNWPLPPLPVTPVKFLGFDARQFLRQAITSLEAQRRGDAVPPLSSIAPAFEDELPTPPSFLSIDSDVSDANEAASGHPITTSLRERGTA